MGSSYERKSMYLGKRKAGGQPYDISAKRFKSSGFSKKKKFRMAVSRAIGVQTKKLDIAQALTVAGGTAGTATSFYCSSIARGAGETERVGNRILTKNINVRGIAVRNAAGASGQCVKIVLLQDTQTAPDNVAWLWADVYGTDMNSHFNVEHTGRYKMLDQVTLTLQDGGQTTVPFVLNSNKAISLRYNGAAATDSDQNGIFVLQIADPNTGVNGPSVALRSRVSFTDA